MRVLVVQRSPFLRLVLREVLARANYETIGECAELDEAASLARRLCPDIVLLDLDGPPVDYLGRIKALRDEVPATYVIALGPPGRPLIDPNDVGVYLSKPCSPEAVLAAIRQSCLAGGVLPA